MQRITIDPNVMTGKPCIRDTRIPVSVVLKLLAMGETWDQILEDYPDIEKEDIAACLAYAADSVSFSTMRIEN